MRITQLIWGIASNEQNVSFTQQQPAQSVLSTVRCRVPGRVRTAFTLVEVLVATALTLIMMAMVVSVFASVGTTISESRASVELAGELRGVKNLLQRDLAGITTPMTPPLRPEEGYGYFELIEGPVGPVIPLWDQNLDNVVDEDSTAGDLDDILMFTTRNLETPFIGKSLRDDPILTQIVPISVTSPVAEVAWFVRGNTLYRRVLLVAPNLDPMTGNADQLIEVPEPAMTAQGFYNSFDLSAREGIDGAEIPRLFLNTLGDLTKRENRYAHQPEVFPHDVRFWGVLGLPTLRETAYLNTKADRYSGRWPFPLYSTAPAVNVENVTYGGPSHSVTRRWISPAGAAFESEAATSGIQVIGGFDWRTRTTSNYEPWGGMIDHAELDPITGELSQFIVASTDTASPGGTNRYAEDVVLRNVLSFDVKVWDPGAPILSHTTPSGQITVMPSDEQYLEIFMLVNETTPFTGPTSIIGTGAYVDLNYLCRVGEATGGPPNYPWQPRYPGNATLPTNVQRPWFGGPGNPKSGVSGTHADTLSEIRPAVYDTWSTHYEYDGIDQDGVDGPDQATSGLPNALTNYEAPPPYAVPLQGIQITIRVFEPDSRQIREVTIVQDFPKPQRANNY